MLYICPNWGVNCPPPLTPRLVRLCLCPCSLPLSQYDSYRSNNSWTKQDRGGSEKTPARKARLLYHEHLMARVWKSAAGPNWTDLPSPQPQRRQIMKSSSTKKLWSSSETVDEQRGGKVMGIEEAAGQQVVDMRMILWTCGVTKLDRSIHEIIRGDNENAGNLKESQINKVEMVWSCDQCEARGTT